MNELELINNSEMNVIHTLRSGLKCLEDRINDYKYGAFDDIRKERLQEIKDAREFLNVLKSEIKK